MEEDEVHVSRVSSSVRNRVASNMLGSVQEFDDRLCVMQTMFHLGEDASAEEKACPTGQNRASPGLDGVGAKRSYKLQSEIFSVECCLCVRL